MTEADKTHLTEAAGFAALKMHDDALSTWGKVSPEAQQTEQGRYIWLDLLHFKRDYAQCLVASEECCRDYPEAWYPVASRIMVLSALKRHDDAIALALSSIERFKTADSVFFAVTAFTEAGRADVAGQMAALWHKVTSPPKN